MSETIRLVKVASGLGVTLGNPNEAVERTGDGGGSVSPSIPKGHAGVLTTRTDANTGTITMSSGGHGITTGMAVDIYFATGIQYKVTVGTVSGTSVPIDLGAGDNLPIATTAVIVCPRVSVTAAIDGTNLKVLVASAVYTATPTYQPRIEARDSSAALLTSPAIRVEDSVPKAIDVTGGDTSPFSGVSATLAISNPSTTEDVTVKVLWLHDATP